MANLSASASVSTVSTIAPIIVSTELHDAPCPHEGMCDGCPNQSVGGSCEQAPSRRLFVTNAFSLGMLKDMGLWADSRIAIRRLADDEARQLLVVCSEAGYRLVSGVGHADTASIFSSILGTSVPMNRVSIDFSGLDLILVGQYNGPRLPEGTTSLPEGASIRWFTIQDVSAEYRHDDRMGWEKRKDPEKEGCFHPWRKRLTDFIFKLIK